MRRNPPAFDKFLLKYQEQLIKVVPPEWLPQPIFVASEAAKIIEQERRRLELAEANKKQPWFGPEYIKTIRESVEASIRKALKRPQQRKGFKEYGAGHYGVVYPTQKPGIVCKITTDATIQNYCDAHRAAPSVVWAKRRQSELEEERSEKELEGNVEIVQEWLAASKEWRLRDDVEIPVMPDSSYRVASPMDAHEICRRAAKDGLCVVDRLKDMVEQAQNEIPNKQDYDDSDLDNVLWNIAVEEGVVTLVLLHDQQYRTIIGLNADGVCTSKHHCTGRSNELDKNAWEYFRAK